MNDLVQQKKLQEVCKRIRSQTIDSREQTLAQRTITLSKKHQRYSSVASYNKELIGSLVIMIVATGSIHALGSAGS